MKDMDEKIAIRVSIISIISNMILTIIKFIAGFFSHSKAMISDSVHSLSDVLSTLVVIIGVKASSKEADYTHPYGHERMECVASLILSIMLFIIGIGIGISGINNVLNSQNLMTPGLFALIGAILSIVVKEIMYLYTIKYAKKINSSALKADAWHHRSDALSSIGSLIGILGSRLGFKLLDPLVSVLICIVIIKISIDIFKDSIDKMIDKSCSEETINKIIELIDNNSDIKRVDDIKTRQFGNMAYIDIEISVDKDLTIEEAHAIAEILHDEVEENIKIVKHCMIHVNPYN